MSWLFFHLFSFYIIFQQCAGDTYYMRWCPFSRILGEEGHSKPSVSRPRHYYLSNTFIHSSDLSLSIVVVVVVVVVVTIWRFLCFYFFSWATVLFPSLVPFFFFTTIYFPGVFVFSLLLFSPLFFLLSMFSPFYFGKYKPSGVLELPPFLAH